MVDNNVQQEANNNAVTITGLRPIASESGPVKSTQFTNQGTMAGAALVKDAMYNGSLLIRLLQG